MELDTELEDGSKEVREHGIDLEGEGNFEAKMKGHKSNTDARIGLVTKKFKLAEADALKNKEAADSALKIAEESKADNVKLAGMVEKLIGEVADFKKVADHSADVKPKDDPAAKAMTDMIDSLNAQFQDAVKSEDFGKALVLGNQITNLRLSSLNKPAINADDIVERVAKRVKDSLPAVEPKVNPTFEKWVSDNDWYGTNKEATEFAEDLGLRLSKSGKYKASDAGDYKKLLAEVKQRTEKAFDGEIKKSAASDGDRMNFNSVENGDYGDKLPGSNGGNKSLTKDEIELALRYGIKPEHLSVYAKTIGKEYKN